MSRELNKDLRDRVSEREQHLRQTETVPDAKAKDMLLFKSETVQGKATRYIHR